MSLDTIMSMSITVESRAPSQAGFGTPLLFGYHTHNMGQLVMQYAQADDMLNDGFTVNDALYKAAQIIKSQNPCPDVFKIGRRVAPLTQVIQLTPVNTTQGYKYQGTIGGKTFSYTVLGGATTTSVAAGIISAINALSAGVTASGDQPGSILGTVVGPWALNNNDTLQIAIDAEVPGSPETVTFTGAAAARETTNSSATPYGLANNDVLNVVIDGGATQTITFLTGSFVDITHATAAEVAAVINAGIVGAKATVTNTNKVTITSDTKGTGSHVQVTGGTANAGGKLNFSTTVVNGTGNVANLAAVQFSEVQSAIQAIVTDCVCTNPGGALQIASLTTGTSSKVYVAAASTADTTFGLDNATHAGTSGGSVVTCTTNVAGSVVDYDWLTTTPPKYLGVKDVTVDTTTDAELPVVDEEDTDWYGLLIVDSSSTNTTLHAAGWIEARRKLFVAQSADTDILDNGTTTDVMSQLQDSSYARTGVIWHRGIGGSQWLAAGWFAGALRTTPGAATMAFKGVPGVKVDVLTSAGDAAILNKNGSYYTDVGLPLTFEGKSGAGEYMDTVRFIDWVYARMRENVLTVLANNPKIPFTDSGVDTMRLAIMDIIKQGINNGGFAASPAPTVTAPAVKDVPTVNRIARTLPDLNWTAQLAGAIHRLNPVSGLVSV